MLALAGAWAAEKEPNREAVFPWGRGHQDAETVVVPINSELSCRICGMSATVGRSEVSSRDAILTLPCPHFRIHGRRVRYDGVRWDKLDNAVAQADGVTTVTTTAETSDLQVKRCLRFDGSIITETWQVTQIGAQAELSPLVPPAMSIVNPGAPCPYEIIDSSGHRLGQGDLHAEFDPFDFDGTLRFLWKEWRIDVLFDTAKSVEVRWGSGGYVTARLSVYPSGNAGPGGTRRYAAEYRVQPVSPPVPAPEDNCPPDTAKNR